MSDCPFTWDDIKLRCRSCEEGECWEWRATFLHKGRRPVIAKRMDTPKGRTNKQFYARHVSYWLHKGRMPELGVDRAIVAKCENEKCVNPHHLRVVSRSVVNRKAAAKGANSSAAQRMKIAQSLRRRSKLSDAAVAEIKASTEYAPVVAERYGITAAYVYMLRRGEFRNEFSNPFAGLTPR